MQDDTDKAQFLQKGLGYSLTGDTSEECFFILYGNTTRNGKGTTTEAILHLMGDYGKTAQPESIAKKQTANGSAHSEDIARLKGARFVSISEPDKGLRLNSALVKQLTGGDTITARFLYQSSFEYKPEFKPFISTNHLPHISDDTTFASGRVKVIPFERHFAEHEQEKGLKSLFRQPQNSSGILNWLIEGLILMRKEGLQQPQAVKDAISQYRIESDTVGLFIDECIVANEHCKTLLKHIYEGYKQWCDEYGYNPVNSRNLIDGLRKKGYEVKRGTGNKSYLYGYSVADTPDGGLAGETTAMIFNNYLSDLPDVPSELDLSEFYR
jgi:putative DNA primase/helicase